MPIYRSDQAQLTFAAEAAPGGSPELAPGSNGQGEPASGGSARVDSANGLPAGSRSIPVSNFSSLTAGTFICIGPGISNGTQTQHNSEIAKVAFIESTTSILLDAPTAFWHPDNTDIKAIAAQTGALNSQSQAKLIKYVPGVYEAIEVPDPEMAIEPRYYLGTASKRNFFEAYPGQQTYTGSLGSFVVLDGRALRFPIGKVTTVPYQSNGTTQAVDTATASLSVQAYKGDMYITFGESPTVDAVDNRYVVLYGGTNSSTSAEALAEAEVVELINNVTGTTWRITSPLRFDHAGSTTLTDACDVKIVQGTSGTKVDHYRHTILETVGLDSMTWHVHVRDSSETDANDFDRRYYGGKVGSMGLSAEEGGLLTCSWDGVNFLGMKHNQRLSSNHLASPTDINVPFYSPMQSIRSGDIVQAGEVTAYDDAMAVHNQQPYYFSQGQVTLFGTVIARVRSFSLSVSNNEEPRYYLKRTMGRHRGPSEIMEQRREYSLSVSLALPDATTNSANTINVFKELLMEGDLGSGMQGFNVELRFDRNQDNQVNDSIIIRIPDDYTGAAGTGAGTGGNNQGAFIRSAAHNITDANPMEVEADILFRNLTIEVRDNIAIYP